MEKTIDLLRLEGAFVEVALFVIIPAPFVESVHLNLFVELHLAFSGSFILSLFKSRFRQLFNTLLRLFLLFYKRCTELEASF